MLDEKTVNFQTSCKDCVFSIKNPKVGQQVGCHAGMLNRFNDKKLDWENGHYLINDICNRKRVQSWWDKHKFENFLAAVEQCEKEIEIASTLIVVVDSEQAGLSFIELLNASPANFVLPKSVFFILTYSGANKDTFLDAKLINNITRRVILPVADKDVTRLIDAAVGSVKTTYYTVWFAPSFSPAKLSELNKVINDDGVKMIMDVPHDDNRYNGFTCSTLAHRIFHGNTNMPLHEKLEESAALQNNSEAVRKNGGK